MNDQRSILHDDGIVEKVLDALHSIIPIVDQIKQSIEDTTSSIPRASSQLTSVTQATETATVEILDVVEQLTQSMTHAQQSLKEVRDDMHKRATRESSFNEALQMLVASRPGDAELRRLRALWAQEQRTEEEINAHLTTIDASLVSSHDAAMKITIALQVQDITSQQIAGVLHLIEGVRNQLRSTLTQAELGTQLTAPGESAAAPTATHFDMDATYTKTPDRQNEADSIIREWSQRNAV